MIHRNLKIVCKNGELTIEEGGYFPLYSDREQEECNTELIARKFWPGKSITDISAGHVSVYRYRYGDKEHYIVTDGNVIGETVEAISDDPLEAVGYAAKRELERAIGSNDKKRLDDIFYVYSKLAEDV